MRIAILAPIWERVPPPAYGGIERVVYLLTEGLVAAGHDVTLFATGDSTTSARLEATEAGPLREMCLPWHDCQPREIAHVLACFRRAEDFDLIHNHAGYLGLLGMALGHGTVLTTLHGPFDGHNQGLFAACRHQPFVSISDAQRRGGPPLNYLGTVYNGIDTSAYALAPKQDYLLNLGRVSPEKGTDVAIEIALKSGLPLIIAGKVDAVDRDYYEERVKPHVDGQRVRFIGEVGGQAKADLLAGALALLHPVRWPEPFGLVMVEAMAAGTPVIAAPLGAIPEVVEPGVTGFIMEDVGSACGAIAPALALGPAAIRQRAIERFDASRMVKDYVAVYEELKRTAAVG